MSYRVRVSTMREQRAERHSARSVLVATSPRHHVTTPHLTPLSLATWVSARTECSSPLQIRMKRTTTPREKNSHSVFLFWKHSDFCGHRWKYEHVFSVISEKSNQTLMVSSPYHFVIIAHTAARLEAALRCVQGRGAV